MQASDIKPDASKFFGLFIGRSSSGKSAASFSFPALRKQYDADLRKGFLGCPWLDLKGTEILQLPPRTATAAQIEKDLSGLENLYNIRQRPYETLIFSSAGSFVRIFLGDARESITGNVKAELRLTGPADFNWTYQAMYNLFDFLKSLPCNVIVEAHVQDKWGKTEKKDRTGNLLEFQENIVIGEMLAGMPPNLGESLLGYFDEVYKFSKNETGTQFFVEFKSNIARSVFPFAAGKHDITGIKFYPWWLEHVNKFIAQKEEVKK